VTDSMLGPAFERVTAQADSEYHGLLRKRRECGYPGQILALRLTLLQTTGGLRTQGKPFGELGQHHKPKRRARV
jgi:hypothetical protein